MPVQVTSYFQEALNKASLKGLKQYRIGMTLGIDPALVSKIKHNGIRLEENDSRVLSIAKLLELDPTRCFKKVKQVK